MCACGVSQLRKILGLMIAMGRGDVPAEYLSFALGEQPTLTADLQQNGSGTDLNSAFT